MFTAQTIARDMIAAGRGEEVEAIRREISRLAPDPAGQTFGYWKTFIDKQDMPNAINVGHYLARSRRDRLESDQGKVR